jgi:hypothetical protein
MGLDSQDEDYNDPLIRTAQGGHVDAVRMLLEHNEYAHYGVVPKVIIPR